MAGAEDTPHGFVPGVGTPAYEHEPAAVDLDEVSSLTTGSVSDGVVEDEDGDGDDRNPEAPPELRDNVELLAADTIGDTVFSKHWLFSTLMRLIQSVDSEDQSKDAAVTDQGVDLDDNLQDELCRLWDMSMNAEIVTFLQEFKAVDILTGVISKSKAPRATEICIGILGNMACNEEACKEIASDGRLIDLILILLEDPDAPTLVEATRLLLVCISSTRCQTPWVDAIKGKESVYGSVKFILQSSTNSDLLCHTANFVDKLFDVAEDVCVSWSCPDFLQALLEAAKQVGSHPSDTLDLYLHIFQLISTSEQGVQALLPHAGDLGGLMIEYLRHVCSEEVIVLQDHGNSLASAFSVLNVIFVSWDQRMVLYVDDFQIIRCLLKVLNILYPKMHPNTVSEFARTKLCRSRSRKDSASQLSPPRHSICENITDTEVKNVSRTGSVEETDDKETNKNTELSEAGNDGEAEEAIKEVKETDKAMMGTLFEVIQGFLVDVVAASSQHIHILVEEQKTNDGCENGGGPTPDTLDYLDSCQRDRVCYMVWTLRETASISEGDQGSSCPVKDLQDSAAYFSLNRLSRIITDSLGIPNVT